MYGKIYSLRDSHSVIYCQKCVNIHFGPITMHRLGRDGVASYVNAIDVHDTNVLLFAVGEIDVRSRTCASD